MEWTDESDLPRVRTDFESVLAEVEAAQPQYPGMWAEVRRYDSPNTAYDRKAKLQKKWRAFAFRTTTDPDTGQGVLWAQHIGGGYDDPDIRESLD